MIFYTAIKNLLLDYALDALFNRIQVNFTTFNLLGGTNTFEEIQIKRRHTESFIIATFCKCTNVQLLDIGNSFVISFDYKETKPHYLGGKHLSTPISKNIRCTPGDLLIVEFTKS